VLQFKTLMDVVFKPHPLKLEDFHPGQAGRQDPTKDSCRYRCALLIYRNQIDW
jgi:hypothetical protein